MKLNFAATLVLAGRALWSLLLLAAFATFFGVAGTLKEPLIAFLTASLACVTLASLRSRRVSP